MSETTNRLLRHMAWANQRVYDEVQKLPDEALNAFLVNADWTAARLLQHIVGGADWYVFCLTEAPLGEIKLPNTMQDLDILKEQLAEFDEKILNQANLPETYLTIKEDNSSWQILRSTILAQAINHATEHRTQLVDALESSGHIQISLDDLDLWSFERFEKNLS